MTTTATNTATGTTEGNSGIVGEAVGEIVCAVGLNEVVVFGVRGCVEIGVGDGEGERVAGGSCSSFVGAEGLGAFRKGVKVTVPKLKSFFWS